MKSKGRILVIEDNLDWQERIKGHLEESGFSIVVANNLDAAKKNIKKENFHVICIDLQMDEKTLSEDDFEGWELLKLAKETFSSVIVLSGFPGKKGENIIKAESKEYKAMKFFPKSNYDKHGFIKKITDLIKTRDLVFFKGKENS